MGDHRLVASLAQITAEIRSAAVLPDNCVMQRRAGGFVPDDHGLALIGDADGRNVLWANPGLSNRGAAGGQRGRPKVGGIMFNPARLREMLGEFFLSLGRRTHLGIE